jgi:hypothetical protein
MVPVVTMVLMMMTAVVAVTVAPVAVTPAAVTHHVHGRHLIRRRGDSGAEPGRRGRRELRCGKHQCHPGQNHQNEFAHEVSLG